MHRASTNSFDILLDNCIIAIQEQGQTVEECLRHHPAHREELEPLLRLVTRLQAGRAMKASAEFRQASAARLQRRIASRARETRRPSRQPTWGQELQQKLNTLLGALQRAPAAVAIGSLIVILLFAGGGTVYAAADALPGDTLYPVKMTIEDTRLAMSTNRIGNAEQHLTFATRRLNEAATLAEANRPQDIDRALSNYEAHIESVSTLLSESSDLPINRQAQIAGLLAVNMTRYHQERLAALLAEVPENTQPSVEQALAASEHALRQAMTVIEKEPDRYVPQPHATPTPQPTLTASPNPAPTVTPTSSPKSSPTSSPAPPERPAMDSSPIPPEWRTAVSTAWPTEIPTAWPTGVPTAWPTGAPTAWPTSAPTAWPTGVPTAWPTGVPTWPTEVPDTLPTAPSSWPTPPPEMDPPEINPPPPPSDGDPPSPPEIKPPSPPDPDGWPKPPSGGKLPSSSFDR